MKWKMKDGNLIEISDMETSHIKNTMAMIERGFLRHINQAISGAWAAAAFFGNETIEWDIERMENMAANSNEYLMETHKQYNTMAKELAKRHLTEGE